MAAANPEFIAELIRNNPCVELPKDQIRTCPVRLSFPHVFVPAKAMEEGKEPKYQVTCLFPAGVDLSLLKKAASNAARASFGDSIPAGSLKTPFRDQGDKVHLEGYVPGSTFFTATALQKPLIVSVNETLITDTSRVYPGVWALVVLKPFTFTNPRKGVSFGLQSLMIIADDEAFGGSGPADPSVDFGGVKVGAQSPSSAGSTNAAADAASLF